MFLHKQYFPQKSKKTYLAEFLDIHFHFKMRTVTLVHSWFGLKLKNPTNVEECVYVSDNCDIWVQVCEKCVLFQNWPLVGVTEGEQKRYTHFHTKFLRFVTF